MEFTLEMNYDIKAMTAMAKGVRKTILEEKDKKSRIIGWVFVVLAALILLFADTFGWMQILAALLVACFACYLIFQDQVNGFLALRRLPAKMRKGIWLFREDGYFSDSEAGESDYSYERIFTLVECGDYLLLCFDNSQAQILNMTTLKGGTPQELRRLLRRKTDLTIQEV